MYCSISLNELTPERMAAYGPLSIESADKLDRVRTELDGLVAKLRGFLGKGAGGDLQQRLQLFGKTDNATRLLTEIERIVAAHGMVEFRETLSMLLDRMESAAFEVGVFGRVSSGKSSLLNYILQTDTPGLGSLAVAGAQETIAYLPRCDLGIVLIDASAGLTEDDLVVVQALYHAGASAMILISKADLFSSSDRDEMIRYVKTSLHEQLRLEAPVHAVTVFGAAAVMCDRWFEAELRPFLTEHQQLVVISQKRKIGVLRENVIAALERRLEVGTVSGDAATVPKEATEALREGDRVLEHAQGESFFLTRKIAKMRQAIIDIIAQRIAAALSNSEDMDPASVFSETLTQMIAEPVAATLRSIEHARDELMKATQLAAATSGHGAPEELPSPAGMPMLDLHEISQSIVIEKPRMLLLLGQGAVASKIRRQLEQQYDRELLEFLSLYANRLRRWMEQSVNALRNAFNAFADMYRAHFEAAPLAPGLSEESAIQNDLRILGEWNRANEPTVTTNT